jgi:hypothetical protein
LLKLPFINIAALKGDFEMFPFPCFVVDFATLQYYCFQMLQYNFFNVALHNFILQYILFDVALHSFVILQYLYPDVTLNSYILFTMLHSEVFRVLGIRGAVG